MARRTSKSEWCVIEILVSPHTCLVEPKSYRMPAMTGPFRVSLVQVVVGPCTMQVCSRKIPWYQLYLKVKGMGGYDEVSGLTAHENFALINVRYGSRHSLYAIVSNLNPSQASEWVPGEGLGQRQGVLCDRSGSSGPGDRPACGSSAERESDFHSMHVATSQCIDDRTAMWCILYYKSSLSRPGPRRASFRWR